MNRNWGRAFAWLLCLALILGLSAPVFAEEAAAETAAVPAAEESAALPDTPEDSILDSDAITKMVEDYLAQKGIPKDRVGIGYCYTATGDEYFYNADTWFYPGSMYKVPLMMDLAERIKNGEVAPGTQIGGLDLDTVFEYILVYSNNDYAHKVRTYLGGDETWREEVKQYAGLDSYDERYMLYCYFSPRYMTRVLETLFREPERFPDVTENLLLAEQGHYFRLPDEMHPYDVAQKYGSYLDQENSDWNHTAGIIYTPNPIILTVMTKNVGGSEAVIGQLAALFKNYTLEVDGQLASWQQEQAQKEAERLAAEQAARLAAEQAESQAQAQQQPAQQNAPQPQPQLQSQTPDRAERGRRAGIIVLLILLAAAIIGGIGAVVIVKERERKRYESYKRRFEAELRQEAQEREQAARRSAQAAARQRAQSAPPRQRTDRADTPPVQRVRRVDTPPRQQPRQSEPVVFDEDQWLHDEEDE